MAYIGIFHNKKKSGTAFVANSRKLTRVPKVDTVNYVYESPSFKGVIQIRKELEHDLFHKNFYETKRHVVFIDGYIADGGPADARGVLDAFLKEGPSFIEKLNGEYNLAIYDVKANEVHLFNDRFGCRPFYFYNDGEKLVASDEIKTILPYTEQSVSESGLLENLLLFHNVEDRTIYSNVHAFKPATHLKSTLNDFEQRTYWMLTYNASRIRLEEFASEVKGVLENAALHRYSTRKKVGLGLSGGLDSRLIAASIPDDLKDEIFIRTYGFKDSQEIQIAQELFKRLHFKEHLIHEPMDISFYDFIFKSVWRTEGQIPFIGLKSITQHDFLKDKMHYNIAGHFGDVLTGKSLRPSMFMPANREKYIEKLFLQTIKLNMDEEIRVMVNDDFFNQYFSEVRDNFYQSFEPIKATNNWDLATIWDLNNRQSRFTFQSSQVDAYIQEPIKLFTDYNYVDLMTKLPLTMRLGQSFYKYMIANSYPEIADIINDNTGVPLKKSIFGNYVDMYSSIRTSLKKRKMRSSTSQTTSYANTSSDPKLKDLLLGDLSDSSFPSQWFDKKGIEQLIEEHYARTRDHNYAISLLATFFTANRLFVVNKNDVIPDSAIPF